MKFLQCLMRKSSSKLWNENCLLQIVELQVFAAICGMTMRSFCYELWNENFLVRNVEFYVFAVNCGLKRFCCEIWNEKFLLPVVD